MVKLMAHTLEKRQHHTPAPSPPVSSSSLLLAWLLLVKFFPFETCLCAERGPRLFCPSLLCFPTWSGLSPRFCSREATHQGSGRQRGRDPLFTFLTTARQLSACWLYIRSWNPRGKRFPSPCPQGGRGHTPSKPQFSICEVGTAIPTSQLGWEKVYLTPPSPHPVPRLSEFILKVHFNFFL